MEGKEELLLCFLLFIIFAATELLVTAKMRNVNLNLKIKKRRKNISAGCENNLKRLWHDLLSADEWWAVLCRSGERLMERVTICKFLRKKSKFI